MSLFGIESAADCRRVRDTLLEMLEDAKRAMNKEAIATIKSRLKYYYQKGYSRRRGQQMSAVEEQYFWPAIQQAYVNAPNLGSRKTWTEGLSEIEHSLNYCCPK
jgi:hypothetical protein